MSLYIIFCKGFSWPSWPRFFEIKSENTHKDMITSNIPKGPLGLRVKIILIISLFTNAKFFPFLIYCSIHQKFYPNCDSVFRPKCFAGSDSNDKNSMCECSSRQCEWFVFNHELVLPEYVIDFEYVTRVSSSNLHRFYSSLVVHGMGSCVIWKGN